MICDWCGKTCSKTLESKEVFHVLNDYVHNPVICEDCYSKLENTHRQHKQKNSATLLS
jgi:uridine kinase